MIFTNKNYLPVKIHGTKFLRPIKYVERIGSAQCKSAVIFGGLKTKKTTIIKAKKSRNHTELLCKYLNLPVKVTLALFVPAGKKSLSSPVPVFAFDIAPADTTAV